ncbi:MAG: hypothetical protein AAF458_14055 [Pseudomonadota bacterium]
MTRDHWLTFKEIDGRNGWPKGAAFRRFKRALTRLTEGRDYIRLDAMDESGEIDALRAGGRLYSSTVHAVLVSPGTADLIEVHEGNGASGAG